ncbi:rbcG, partial [Symbiodinium necroappetens]
DTGSAEKEGRSPQGSGEERLDVSSSGANKEVLKEDEEYLHAEDSEDGEYSDEEECSSQHSVAEHNDVMASGAEADEASGANEEAEKEEPAEILSKVSVPEGGDFMCPSPPCDLQEEADKDEYSDGSGSEGLEGEEGEEDEYSDEEQSECSSQHSVAEHNDVMASGAEADEASGANEEAEKEEPAEILSK